jgi:uncharacterized protein (DUF1800 family)
MGINLLEKYNGPWTDSQVRHLLSRTTFGTKPEDVNLISKLDFNTAISTVINAEPKPLPPVNYYENIVPDPNGIKYGETWINAPYGNGDVNFRRVQVFRYWWISNLWKQQTNINQKLTLFWHNHFATELSSYDIAQLGYRYYETLRTYSMGNFKNMVKAISIDPAMLKYLNGYKNKKSAPDENYARELQELFTVGKGPEAKYTEDDVKSAAKVLTGFRYKNDEWTYFFDAKNHDTTDKQFSSFYGNKLIKGQSGADGEKELDEMISMIFENNEVAKFIIRKLHIFFIHHDITTDIEANFITPLAELFRKGNYELKPVLIALFSSNHFFNSNYKAATIDSPLDFVIKTMRYLNPSYSTNDPQFTYEYYSLLGNFMRVAESCQQYIGDPPNVAGWPAYYQAPVFNEIWINSDTFQKRVKFINDFIKNGFTRNKIKISSNLMEIISKFKNPENPNTLIDTLVSNYLQLDISKNVKTKMKVDILLTGQSSDYYWTDLWNQYLANPTKSDIKNMVETRLKNLFIYIFSLPEYQLS